MKLELINFVFISSLWSVFLGRNLLENMQILAKNGGKISYLHFLNTFISNINFKKMKLNDLTIYRSKYITKFVKIKSLVE